MHLSLRSLVWPTLAATLLHASLGWQLFAHWSAAVPGARTVLAISLLPPIAPVERVALPPPLADPDRKAMVLQSEPAPIQSARTAQAASSIDVVSPRASAQVEHFFAASELTRLPALPGEPIIDLGEGSEMLDGSIALQLFIDESGRVVQHRVESNEGLPDAIVDKLTRAFSGYPYIAGQRERLAVKCQVTLVIAVRQGQAAMGGPQ
jgi:hypothetical protein